MTLGRYARAFAEFQLSIEQCEMAPIDEILTRRVKEAQQLKAAWERRFGSAKGTRRELAQRYGVTEGFIGLLLTGHSSISSLWKLRMAEYLGMSPTEIWPEFDLHQAILEQFPDDVAELVRAALDADPDRRRAALLLLQPPHQK